MEIERQGRRGREGEGGRERSWNLLPQSLSRDGQVAPAIVAASALSGPPQHARRRRADCVGLMMDLDPRLYEHIVSPVVSPFPIRGLESWIIRPFLSLIPFRYFSSTFRVGSGFSVGLSEERVLLAESGDGGRQGSFLLDGVTSILLSAISMASSSMMKLASRRQFIRGMDLRLHREEQ